MSNRQLEDRQEEYSNKQLALSLGITHDELCQLNWEIDTNESSDGMIYNYIITFDKSSSNKILEKINGINLNGRYVELSSWCQEDYTYQ